MATATDLVRVSFPDWYDLRAELETPAKGHLAGVEVRLPGGSIHGLTFYDPVRLRQTLEDDAKAGRPFFAEPGLIILPEVTTSAIRQAVQLLWEEGFFQHLKPLAETRSSTGTVVR